MDIEFIELEHRENVLKLMEICGIDMKEAYQLYTDANYNFQAAVNRKFNPLPQPSQQNFQPYPPQYQQAYIPPENHGFGPGGFAEDAYFDDDIEMTQYRKFKQSGRSFQKLYPNRSNEGFFKSFIKFVKGNEQIFFKNDLQRYLQRQHINIKLEHNNLSDAFHWCWKEKFPLAVILLDFSEAARAITRKLFSDDLLIEKIISQQFKAFGINTQKYELEPELKPFFDLRRDANTIVLCRVNHLDNIEIVKRIRIDENLQDIKKKIKQAKSECIQNQLDQSHIVRQFHEEMRGNFNYSRPKTIKQSIKMREDKKLRKQQEEEYFKACQSKKEKQPIQQKLPERKIQQKPQPRPQYTHQTRPPSVPPSLSIEKVNQMRAEKLSKQRKYITGIMFKIRVPQGRNLIVQVDQDETVQYLFDFIEYQPEDLGFSNQLERKFDLCVGFGSGQTLKGKEKAKLKQLFEGSQVLIVREL